MGASQEGGGKYHSFVLSASFEVPMERLLASVRAGETSEGFEMPTESRSTEKQVSYRGNRPVSHQAGFKAGDSYRNKFPSAAKARSPEGSPCLGGCRPGPVRAWANSWLGAEASGSASL